MSQSRSSHGRARRSRRARERALARKGMPDYDDWTTQELEHELKKRGITWGLKKDPGKCQLLMDDNDRLKLAGGSKTRGNRTAPSGSAGGAGRPKKKAKASRPKQTKKGSKAKGKAKGRRKKQRR